METNNMTLDQKILELKKIICIMQKNAEGYGYKFVTEDSILLAINEKMIELGLKLTPRFKEGSLNSEIVNYKDAKGKEKTDVKVQAELSFVWKDIYTGETEIIDWGLMGQQGDASQALGSGLTYANRYFLLKYFNVATIEDDPDKIRSEIKAEEERRKISATQTKCKKLFAELLKIHQKSLKVYEILGTTKEQFQIDYNNEEKVKNLIDQMELILKGDK